jgi:hypothetical protein
MTSRVSPGGALLRRSRLFTLPQPIPPPPGDFSSGTRFNSDTATLAYPTHQVVTTPEFARNRGDWGLKRELPLKSTKKTSNPQIRVKQVDSVEHITDFVSGGDHGITLRKWQEMNMPVSRPQPKHTNAWARGKIVETVFDESGDFTVMDKTKELAAENHRWKFRGPWLAGMTEGEFKTWLARKVRPQRSEFRKFLKQVIAEDLSIEATASNMDEDGLGQEHTEKSKIDPETITEAQLNMFLRQLRVERPRLYRLVGRFLDLAPINPPQMAGARDVKIGLEIEISYVGNPYASEGPPVTHPSAGLSYLRTNAFLENHPIYGPQKDHAPVEARIVKPRYQTSQGQHPTIGVGGIIASAEIPHMTENRANRLLTQFDPSIEGGAKMWVKPQSATITSTGRINLKIEPAPLPAVYIAKELIGEDKVYGTERPQSQDEEVDLNEFKSPQASSNGLPFGGMDTYGLKV